MLAGDAQQAQMQPCALRLLNCDAAAYLEETQKLDVRGVRVRLHHVRQQRLLGSGAGGRDLRELQAGTALQRRVRSRRDAVCTR